RRHRRLEAAMAAESLREFAEGRSVQEHGEGPADGRAAAARAGTDRVEQRALGGRQLVFGENGDAGRRDLLGRLPGRLLGRHWASSFAPSLGLWRAGLLEQQRLDDDRYHVGELDDAPDVDVIEFLELHAVNRDHVGHGRDLVADDAAEALADVA